LPTSCSLAGTKGLGHNGEMTPEPATHPGYRFPAAIISYAVWLYHVFGLSLREVEFLLAERGITTSHESIRQRCRKFGADFARKLRQRRPKPGDTWHLDEVLILSANSGCRGQSCETGHPRPGCWHAVEHSYHP
jgi:putative transposase